MTRTILLLVDHKHRDLPSLSLIGFELRKRGWTVGFAGLGLEDQVVRETNPSVVAIPKVSYDTGKLAEWKRQGRRLVVIETEGNPQHHVSQLRVPIAPDLYLFWNETIASRYRNRLSARGTESVVLGFTRSDFLHPRLDRVFPAGDQLLAEHGLDPSAPTITVATATQDSHFSPERLKEKARRRKRSFARTQDYWTIVANMRKLRELTVNWLPHVLAAFPRANLVLKPHPHENVVFWADFLASLGRERVALVTGQPINHLLRMSDFHISHNGCTTGIEAMLSGIPVAEIHTDLSATLIAERHLRVATYGVRTLPELLAALGDLSSRTRAERAPDLSDAVAAYVRDFFHVFDGRRCEAYASAIETWFTARCAMASQAPRRLALPEAALEAALGVRRRLSRWLPRGATTPDVVLKVNRPSQNQGRDVRRINGTLVDAEYGLFDNRMFPGDEQFWLCRFEAAGLGA